MKEWTEWGIKVRDIQGKNYHATWNNLKTLRTGSGRVKELDPLYSEFYDIGLGTRCQTGNCPFCYTSASEQGKYNLDVIGAWRLFLKHYREDRVVEGGMTLTEKPFQVALGSTSEPTEHPEFCQLLEEIYLSDVVPNYATNGVILGS